MLSRDPTIYVARIPIFIVMTAFFAVLYWNARQARQDQVMPKVFFTMMIIEFPGMFSLVVCYSLNFELKAVKREVKDGMYKPATYWLVFTLIQIPMIFRNARCSGTHATECVFPADLSDTPTSTLRTRQCSRSATSSPRSTR